MILAKVRHFVPSNLLADTYYAHIQPHIDYGLNLWGYAAQTHVKDIITQQKKAVRIMCFKNSRETAKPLFTSKNILPFHENLQLQAGKVLWRAANDCLCPTLNPLFNMRDDESSFHLPHRRLDVSQNSITYSGVKFWNAIPADIRSSTSLNIFKNKYKRHLQPNNDVNNNTIINNNINSNNNNNINNNTNRHGPRLNQRWRLNINQPFVSRWNV